MADTTETKHAIHVTSETLGPCRRLLKIEVPTADVDKEFGLVAQEYTRYARLPGFRPGRAPRPLVEKRFTAEIEQEVQKSLIPKAYREAIRMQSLQPVGLPEIKDVQFGRGQPLAFTAELETAPDFALPDYKGIAVTKMPVTVTDEDVDKAVQALAAQRAELVDATGRGLAMEDFAVVNFSAVSDGKPLAELAPAAKALAERKDLLLMISPEAFVPGFCEQLVGAMIGEKRQVLVDFPADFQVAEIAGKKATYFVEVTGIKERKLPPMDDALAASFGKDLTLAKLKDAIRADIQRERERAAGTDAKNQVVEFLLSRTTFDLPPAMLANETRHVIQDVVRENTMRGIAKEALVEKKDEIFQFASKNAADRLKASFILGRIASLEKVEVQQQEIEFRILQLAQRYEIQPAKLRKQLEERGGLDEIHEELLVAKTLEFLVSTATVTQK
ncbi:MAG: trigger factor [Verrucomicrobia bacterium]|nr:trigger factor [Verrucomicrobiota bacterium]